MYYNCYYTYVNCYYAHYNCCYNCDCKYYNCYCTDNICCLVFCSRTSSDAGCSDTAYKKKNEKNLFLETCKKLLVEERLLLT